MVVNGNKRLWVFDTEDDSKGNLYMIVFYNGEQFYVFRDAESAINFLSQLRERAIFFAVNLEYDIQNLFRGRIASLRLTFGKSFIVSALFKRHLFYDTQRHWKLSVADMGKYIGLEKGDFDPTNVEYCKRDCEVTFGFVSRMLENYKRIGFTLRSTLPSTVLRFWRENYYSSKFIKIPASTLEVWKKAYYGGRTECFYIGKFMRPVRVIDVNSLYPYVMRKEYPFPYEYEQGDFRIKEYGITSCRVYSDLEVPLLPVRHKGKNIYPNGEFTGYWTNAELDYFVQCGGRITRVFDTYNFPVVSTPFRDFVEDFYKKRQQAKDDLMRMTYKIAMNSLYGKFGQGNEVYRMMAEERFLKLKRKPKTDDIRQFGDLVVWSELGEYPHHTNYVWAIYTTAYARIYLHQKIMEIKRKGGEVLYCDTDSVFYHAKDNLIDLNDKLGAFKDEGIYKGVDIRMPKLYKLFGDGGNIYKAKGVPKRYQSEFFETGRAVYKKPVRLRESLRRGIPGNLWIEHPKELKAHYDKGKITKSGWVEPLIMGT